MGIMHEGFQFLDIVFFALVAGFLILRLRSVLGRRDNDDSLSDRRPQGLGIRRPVDPLSPEDEEPDDDTVVPFHRPQLKPPPVAAAPINAPVVSAPVAEALARIGARDEGFSPDHFLGGARAAFAMILKAFADGNLALLRGLLSDEVFANFKAAIDARTQAKETLTCELEGLRSVVIAEADIRGEDALVTVRFVSDQVNVIHDSEGRIVEGDPNRVSEIIDFWTFARPLAWENPNWVLVATRSGGEG